MAWSMTTKDEAATSGPTNCACFAGWPWTPGCQVEDMKGCINSQTTSWDVVCCVESIGWIPVMSLDQMLRTRALLQ